LNQFFVCVGSTDRDAVDETVRSAAVACTALRLGARASLDGPDYRGWYVPGERRPTSPSVGKSNDGSLHVLVAGTWFARDANYSPDVLAQRITYDGVEATVATLDGAFALVAFDHRRRAVHVATDVPGTFHVFVAKCRAGWAISTSSACLAATAGSALDPLGAQEFIATGIIYEDRTLWRGVRKLGQSQVTSFLADGTTAQRRYWSFLGITPEHDDLSTSIARVADGMTSAATAIGTRYPRVLCDITGGYDSRATIAAFLMAGVPFAGTVSGAEGSPDVVISKAIAARFGIEHRHVSKTTPRSHEELVDAVTLTDGEADSIEYASTSAVHRGHAVLHDVSVNGSFGELARGYWWELLWPAIASRVPVDAAMLARRRFAAMPYDARIFSEDVRIDLVSHMTGVVQRANESLQGMPNTTLMDHSYFSLRMHRWQGRIASSTSRIWPNVSLFAFRSVLEPVLEAKASSRIRSRMVRSLLASRIPALAEFPLDAGYPSLPLSLSNVHKFWPAVPHYARRLKLKLARARPSARPQVAAATQTRMAVDAREMDMLIADGIFASDGLQSWMKNPTNEAQYRRLVTLGVVLAEVRSIGANKALDEIASAY